MNIQARYPNTPDEFLRWNERREGKREFVRGSVVELMIQATRNHVRLATGLVVALSKQLDPTVYDIGSADFAVKTPDGIRYPDVFVDRITPESRSDDLAATRPVQLAEVLSPSSYGRDFIEKLADYRGVETADVYLILSQEEPRVWVFTRNTEGWNKPLEVVGQEGILELSALDAAFPLAELYAGIELRR